MIATDWRDLALTSITDPASAARSLLNLTLPREAIWTALILVAVLNTMLFTLSNVLAPGPSPLPGLFDAPTVYLGFVFFGLVMVIYAIFWVGRAVGGEGSLLDVMVLIVWLQGLRVVVQAVALVLLLIMPLLSGLLVIAAAIVGVYILVNFVNQAHRFESLGKSAGVLIGAFIAMVLIVSILLSLVGGPLTGVSNV